MGVQFHPEKSGGIGVNIIGRFLRHYSSAGASVPSLPAASTATTESPEERTDLTRRIVACLDVRCTDAGELAVTKGDQVRLQDRALHPFPNACSSTRSGMQIVVRCGTLETR